MRQNLIKTAVKDVITFAKSHDSEILLSCGLISMGTSLVMAVKATAKAVTLIEDKKDELGVNELSVKETVKTTWKCYISTALTTSVSVTCLLGSHSSNMRKNAAYATAAAISNDFYKSYQDKVAETFGEKKEQTVRDAMAKEKLNDNPVSKTEVIVTKKGDTLCYDILSGRYFKSDMDLVQKAFINLNYQMLSEDSVTVNDYYYELGLDNIPQGDTLGWSINTGKLEPSFSTQLADDGRPCLVVSFKSMPTYDFMKF